MSKIKLQTKIQSFEDVQKSLQEIEKNFNELSKSVNVQAESEVTDKDGKTGDIQISQNKDKSYTFEIKTKEGWKTPVIGDSAVKFKGKPAERSKLQAKSIDELETEDSTKGSIVAKKTIFDEKNDEFSVRHLTGIPRPDYDSGWVALTFNTTVTMTHNLNLTDIPSLYQFFLSDTDNPVLGTNQILSEHYGLDSNNGTIMEYNDANSIYIHAGDSRVFYNFNFGNIEPTTFVSGYCRVKLWK